jgi:hypothetical protein
MSDPTQNLLAHLFEPMPLPRGRAVLSLVFGGLALLALGGVLAYASESPDIHGGGATRYWCAVFLYYSIALAGAALLGAFPRLASPRMKIAWVVLTLATAALALALRHNARPLVEAEWRSIAQQFAAGMVPLVIGLWWKPAHRLRSVDGLPAG